MLVAVLIGLGVGFLGLFFMQVKLQRDLRVLLSDTHLAEMMKIINSLGAADGEQVSLAGVGFSRATGDDGQEFLWIRAVARVPAVGIPWIIAVASVLMDTMPQAQKTDAKHWRMGWTTPRPAPAMDDVLTALRQDAADRLAQVSVDG